MPQPSSTEPDYLWNLGFDVEGEPVPKGRPRMTRAGHTYTPTKTRKYEESVRQATRRAMEDAGITAKMTDAVTLRLLFLLKRGKTVKRKRPTVRPDLDNYIKAALDGLDPLLKDDALVVEILARKRYADGEQAPCVRVLIEAVGASDLRGTPRKYEKIPPHTPVSALKFVQDPVR